MALFSCVAVCDFCTLSSAFCVQLLGPFIASFGSFSVCVFVVSLLLCLDEDRTPGGGECGRPLRR